MYPDTPSTATPSIRALSDGDLVARLDDLARRERLTTLEILFHLAEVDRRRLWRDLEYHSMFEYCTRRLRYSEGATLRRLRVARLIARYPDVHDRIRDGRLSLCAVSKIAPAVLDDGRADLLAAVEGKRLDQVDAIVATHRNPERPVRESIRLLCVERRAARPPAPPVLAPPAKADGAEASPEPPRALPAPPASPPAQRTTIERVFRLQFGIDADTMTMFSRVQSIAATRARRHVDLSELFAILCDTYLRRHDPVRRAQARAGAERSTPVTESQPGAPAATLRRRRDVPQAVRDAVFRRDGGRCTFVDAAGHRCEATLHLHLDHVRPFALGGTNDAENLRLMCPAHNRLLAERTYGKRALGRFDRAD